MAAFCCLKNKKFIELFFIYIAKLSNLFFVEADVCGFKNIKHLIVLDKKLKGILGVRNNTERLFFASGPRTKNFARIFCRSFSKIFINETKHLFVNKRTTFS